MSASSNNLLNSAVLQPHPDDDNVRLVPRRGLVVHHHHYNLLGINMFAYPLGARDWDWRKDTGTMGYAWRAAIAAQAAYPEVVWSLGMRGLNDDSYPNCKGDVDCGAQLTDALGNQTEWLAAAGQGNASRVLYLWDELLHLVASGDLILPPGVDVIFADAGAGYIEVDGSATQYATGMYYHTAMYNYDANQLVEMVPVDRIVTQLTNFSKWAKETKYAIINLSDLRPVPMTSLAFLQYVWDPTPFIAADANTTARAFYASFGTSAVGLVGPSADAYASIWVDYFRVPFIQGALADNTLGRLLQALAPPLAHAVASGANVTAALVSQAQSALGAKSLRGNATHVAMLALLSRAQAVGAAVPPARQAFFASHTLLELGTIGYAAHALFLVSESIVAYGRDGAGALPAVRAAATDALASMDALMSLRRAAETGQWAGFFYTDHLTDMQFARKAVRQLVGALAASTGAPLAPLPAYLW